MQIRSSIVAANQRLDRPKPVPSQQTATLEMPADKVELSSSGSKVAGSVGAMTGALTGRVLASVAGGVAGGVAASLLGLGTVGTVVGSALGLAGSSYLEQKIKVGRLAGGMVGGVLGAGLGAAADVVGLHPSEKMAHECRGFTLKSLPGKLWNTHYTSHPRLTGEIVKEGVAKAQPGDLIMTNDDGNFMIEILQKLTGGGAHWTHNYMVDNDGTVMDILIDQPGPTRWPLEHAFTDNGHAQILRPRYKDQESLEKTLESARSQFGKISYDFKFDLKTDETQYCQEYAYKALQEGAPEIKIEPRKALFLRNIVSAEEIQESPQIDEVWSTGSNFWLNWLSHFN
jgi:hypothetical protein